MPETFDKMIDETLSGIKSLWRRLTGEPDYELVEGKERILDPRRVILDNMRSRRRAPHSGHGCRY